MTTPTPLIPQLDLIEVYPTIPGGILGLNPSAPPPWAQAYEQVHLTLSSGETVYVGTVLALLQLVTEMLKQGQHVINPSEDIFIALAGPAKLIIGEMTFQNQKLLNSGCFVYVQGRLEVWARNGSCVYTLDEALQCVGHYRTSPDPYEDTGDLLAPTGVQSPRLLVVDYRYSVANPGAVKFADIPAHSFPGRI